MPTISWRMTMGSESASTVRALWSGGSGGSMQDAAMLPTVSSRGSWGMVGLSLDPTIDLYLDHVKVKRGLSRNTVLAYATDLARFRAYCAAQGLDSAGAIEPSHI